LRSLSILFTVLLFSVCSTIEKQGYFTPDTNSSFTAGPKKQSCGFANFGGLPDQYVSSSGDDTFTVTAHQYFNPYFWGPWFVAIVPVFPISWAVNYYTGDDLQIEVSIEKGTYNIENIHNISISYIDNGETKMVEPSSIKMHTTFVEIVFPVDAMKVEKMIFHMEGFGKQIDIPFSRTSRWSWTQWTPNC